MEEEHIRVTDLIFQNYLPLRIFHFPQTKIRLSLHPINTHDSIQRVKRHPPHFPVTPIINYSNLLLNNIIFTVLPRETRLLHAQLNPLDRVSISSSLQPGRKEKAKNKREREREKVMVQENKDYHSTPLKPRFHSLFLFSRLDPRGRRRAISTAPCI